MKDKVANKEETTKSQVKPHGVPNVKKSKEKPVRLRCRATQKVLDIWKRETEFINGVFALLPSSMREGEEDLDEYLIDLSDSEETKKRDKFLKKTQDILEEQKRVKEDQASGLSNEEVNSSADADPSLASSPSLKKQRPSTPQKPTREELLEKLHAKIALVAQKKNPNKSKVKRDKVEGKKDRRKDSKKQFISKTNPNLKQSVKQGGGGGVISNTPKLESSVVDTSKTPLRTPTVKKSDGQVVYSKFDFIAPAKSTTQVKANAKSKVTDILKNVEKTEEKIARLEASGKKSEAVEVAEGQKWITALKRAEGQKVRDDPNLLKKTIKKDKKMKEARKKKWTERVATVEKVKEMKVKKRQANIQERKDDKKKKQKKLLRKKGRII